MKKILLAMLPLLCSCSHYSRGLVDLGLSVRWNGCNLGAQAPHEAGDFYAWGELGPKDKFLFVDCVTESMDIPNLRSSGFIDGDGHLTARHDAAAVGSDMQLRMPTTSSSRQSRI